VTEKGVLPLRMTGNTGQKFPGMIMSFLIFLFLVVVMGFELRDLPLQGRRCTV
jgi:hypothetical protein